MFVTMKIKAFVLWLFLAGLVGFTAGASGGAFFTKYQADQAIDAAQTRIDGLKKDCDDLQALNQKLTAALGRMNATAGSLLDRVGQDESVLKEYTDDAQASVGESTVIYERSPQLQIRFTGIRGLPVIPLPGNSQELPRVLIPGHVKPMILAPDGDARQAVFFYLDKKNRMHGPFAPEVVRPQ